jgi:four helix bundle protein
MAVQHYGELIAWQKAMDFATAIYRATGGFPDAERFGLTNQMRRAAVSVPSNIAEGQGRGTTKDFLHFLYIARGSLQEVETQTLLAHRLGFLSADEQSALANLSSEVSRILGGLIRSLATSH